MFNNQILDIIDNYRHKSLPLIKDELTVESYSWQIELVRKLLQN